MWMSCHVSARTVGRVDVIAAAMFVLASVINLCRVDAGGALGKAAEVPQLQEQRDRKGKFVAHVTVNSISLMVAMADQEKPKARSTFDALRDADKRW